MSAVIAEHVRALAPDGAALKAAQQLASAPICGTTIVAIWDEILISGSKPYQVRVDLRDSHLKCSCPSRKLPCKYGWAMVLIYCDAGNQVPSGESPDWLIDRLEGPDKCAIKVGCQVGKSDKPRDEEAAAKRTEERESKVGAGVAELPLRNADIARNGLGTGREKPGSFCNNIAARVVDALAPGMTRVVETIQSTLIKGEGWQKRMYKPSRGFTFW